VRVILNADDFGHSDETVRATIACFTAGALTSATIMARMPATQDALAFARSRTEFSYGVHLTFVGDGIETPLSPPAAIPALVDEHGRFRRTNEVRRDALLGRLPVDQIAREAEAQIAAVRDEGVEVSHVDSHRHLHKFGPFREALKQVLPRFGITRLRNVQDVYVRRPVRSPTFWIGPIWRRRLMHSFATTDHFFMGTGEAEGPWADGLLERVGDLGARSLEIGVHPGTEEPWRAQEGRSVEQFAAAAKEREYELITWRDLPVHR
jgi:chitin disaccharide deacetylase